MLLPVVLAGGSGSRLWPLSRELMPKQFLTLHGEKSLLQSTLLRLEGISAANPLVICNEEHRFIAAEQLRQLNLLDKNIILEPISRNTAPAITIAALYAMQNGEDPILLVLAADHVFSDIGAFEKAIITAEPLAEKEQLVTFGIKPAGPETGYGYIKQGKMLAECASAYQVKQFIEKPTIERAKQLLLDSDVCWNSGMFMFKASAFLKELAVYRPDILLHCQNAVAKTLSDTDFMRINKELFMHCPADSIDYAVMEHTQSVVVVPIETQWSDIGSWSALWELGSKDVCGNVQHGAVLQLNSNNNYVYAESGLVATVGLENTIVIQTNDAVLVANKDQVQQIKEIVKKLKEEGRSEHYTHRQVYRPWGQYDVIDQGEGYKVKRITVLPGEKLSLQKHQYRAEHWIVVSGQAKVTLGNVEQTLVENQSIYIPIGCIHALENPGNASLELIEVQSGRYLEEDDIERFTDRYGRI
ncbi:mannose-1-phosphate guanylyltransferase/mannose-6-phosphate isomerase [Alishewanella sp. SMS8]|uniref:mannose-1-phosphate guanylyltransferase/mannose-6-phosphate isomerase n=1 Tax=Alishewanella sp. SMS8 TaxID=2994676 RepID=UPI0027412A83|nr:mannose-1-phosphate guanylyltransferase/mannose-6-phosphate isomerase [Alishewanella sp. SMS8]MDP5460122.1 mannose-1-phosphate guanylyltransferase/mannose-6-phosphate isomerase [Alishewanella sp. SMS8]